MPNSRFFLGRKPATMVMDRNRYGFLFSVPGGRAVAGIDFRQVRSIVSMAEVLDLLDFVPVTSRGGQLRGPCPLHGSTSPKSHVFSANLAKNTFQCFVCHAAGNHLDLWAAATKQAIYAAALDLCNKLNREIPWLGQEQRRGTRKALKDA